MEQRGKGGRDAVCKMWRDNTWKCGGEEVMDEDFDNEYDQCDICTRMFMPGKATDYLCPGCREMEDE